MELTLVDHIKELRSRIFKVVLAVTVGAVISFVLFDPLVSFFSAPFLSLMTASRDPLVVHSLFEGFSTKMRFSLMFGIVIAFPIILFHVLRFVLPGLSKSERWVVFWGVALGSVLAGFSVYLVYFYLLPFSITFLTSAQFIPQNVGLMLNYKQNVFYVFNVLLGAMVAFQFPIILFLLMKMGVLKRAALWAAGRYVIVGVFVVSAIVTPPDVVTQLGFALPLIFLFYGTLALAKITGVGK